MASNVYAPSQMIDLEYELRRRGFQINCGPSHQRNGQCPRPGLPGSHGHLRNSTHYVDRYGNPYGGPQIGGAIDVGKDPSSGAAISTYEKAHLDDLARELMRRKYRVIWGVANHYDHLHVDYALAGGHSVNFIGPNAGFTVSHIKWVQTQLKALGFYTGRIDGLREAGTKAAIIAFQRKYGLAADALPGNATTTKIKALV